MTTLDSVITVKTTPAYPIIISQNEFHSLPDYCQTHIQGRRIGIVTQPNLVPLYAASLQSQLEKIGYQVYILTIPHGELPKNLNSISHLLDELIKNRFERIDGLLALGGGVIGDMTGFLASIFLRGIAFAQIPTTLLAQVDAAIGGKTGVNHELGKNLIGTFYQPKFVYINPKTLETLPQFEWKSGIAEIIKYGMIQSESMFESLSKNVEKLRLFNLSSCPEIWTDLITQSCHCKAFVVGEDEKESHLREILNFGHTLGHAIEAQFNYQGYSHGEAVALGMVAATKIATEIGLCTQEVPLKLSRLLTQLNFDQTIKHCNETELTSKLFSDKKTRSNVIRWVLPHRIGHATPGHCIPIELITKTITEMIQT